jgi:hypothetical protein
VREMMKDHPNRHKHTTKNGEERRVKSSIIFRAKGRNPREIKWGMKKREEVTRIINVF